MEKITAQQFSEADGVEDWRVLWWQAFAVYRTGDFATGLAFVNEIGRLAEAADHHPDLNLRYGRLEIRLATHSAGSLTDLDLSLAREISAAARALGVEAEVQHVRTWEFALDAMDVDAVRDFWCAVLGYERDGDTDVSDPLGLYPPVYVQQMDQPRTGRNRIHIDVGVPHDQARARVAEALAAGGTLVNDDFAPAWWTLADPEGNEVDIATWQGRD
ncbi:pterin-4-alpha-carbinolamine dehydratase [Nocardioides sp. GY 10113]|uniref:VOC family protein n=1 Tax=Nocardioides sp. GY 10113 TaxID=2569761 RepID=UPI0010A7CA91|nr:VOC family protein [Nocardioides sp. GY 10113]TIC89046.1 pterin-4-alpha-carbinolamine dehydratase [Nocardioides sp. GY 10113]